MKRNKEKIFLFLLSFLFFINYVFSQEINLTDREKANICLNESELIILRLERENFSVKRINDSLKEAKMLFIVQDEIAKKGIKADYEKILTYCNEIKKIDEMAHLTRDQFKALEKFYKEYAKNINSNDIEDLLSQIKKEIKNERYELVPELIEKTYSTISAEQAKNALLTTYYSATTKGLKSFVKNKWKEIIISICFFIVLFFMFNKPIRKHILKRKILYLKMRRNKLKEMIAKNQDDYFNKGKISQMDFEIKNKKLAEIVRDINRQIPLLEEELNKIGEKNANSSVKNKKR